MANEMYLLRSLLGKHAVHGVLTVAQTSAYRRIHELVREEFDVVLQVQKPTAEQRSAMLVRHLCVCVFVNVFVHVCVCLCACVCLGLCETSVVS